MEEHVRVDRQGRLVLPARLRERIGLKEGGEVVIRLDGSRLILEPSKRGLVERVEAWRQEVLAMRVEAFTEESREEWKWIDREYAERKLRLR